jgi:hypothetical protein
MTSLIRTLDFYINKNKWPYWTNLTVNNILYNYTVTNIHVSWHYVNWCYNSKCNIMSSYFRHLSTYLGVLVFLVVQQGPVVLLDHHSSLIESSVCSYCTLKLHITLRIVTSINIMPGNMYVGHCVIIKDVVYRQISSIRSFVLIQIKVHNDI